jgi:septin 7
MKQILASKIKIYEFPDLEEAEENERKENKKMKDRVPFAVVGSNTGIELYNDLYSLSFRYRYR